MFLSNQTSFKIEKIIRRILKDEEVSLKERIFVEKYAHHESNILNQLKKANSIRRNGVQDQNSINGLLQSLGLEGLESENFFDPKSDDLADWFNGSPEWVRRS